MQTLLKFPPHIVEDIQLFATLTALFFNELHEAGVIAELCFLEELRDTTKTFVLLNGEGLDRHGNSRGGRCEPRATMWDKCLRNDDHCENDGNVGVVTIFFRATLKHSLIGLHRCVLNKMYLSLIHI